MLEAKIIEVKNIENINTQLRECLDSKITNLKPLPDLDNIRENPKNELADKEKIEIKEKTGWSDEIINNISSVEEADIYIKPELKEVEINGKPCLIKSDIDNKSIDEMGRTNEQRMKNGLAPLDKDAKPIELHHIGQKRNSPLAELTQTEHRGPGNDGTLHNKKIDSEINRGEFNTERKNHWKERVKN